MNNRSNALSIIIVTWNNERTIGVCIDSIKRELSGQYEIIVVDNCSNDKTVEIAKIRGVEVKKNKSNLGFSKANNIAVKYTHFENLAFINPDVKVTSDLSTMHSFLKDNIGLVSGKIYNTSGQVEASCYNFETPVNIFAAVFALGKHMPKLIKKHKFYRWSDHSAVMFPDWVMGAFMVMKKKVYLAIGGFSEDYFLYAEDMDICYKLYLKGYKTMFLPQYKITHVGGVSEQQIDVEKFGKLKKSITSSKIFAKKYGLKYNVGSQVLSHKLRMLILKIIKCIIFNKKYQNKVLEKIELDRFCVKTYKE